VCGAGEGQELDRIRVKAEVTDPGNRALPDEENFLRIRAIASDQIERLYQKSFPAPTANEAGDAGELTIQEFQKMEMALRILRQITGETPKGQDPKQMTDDELLQRIGPDKTQD
jgi:hypothetical protein